VARDSTVYDAIVVALQGTNAFTAVDFGEPGGAGPASSDWLTFVSVNHVSADEIDVCTPIKIDRRVQYRIEIAVREEDPATRTKELDRLCNVARSVLNGVSLGGLTFPAFTLLRRDTTARPKHPEDVRTLTGEFLYEIDGYGGHDATA